MTATTIMFDHPGPPQGKGRLRHRVIRSRANPMGYAGGYTPGKTRLYELTLKRVAERAMAGLPLKLGALMVEVQAFFQVPASWSNKKRQRALDGFIRPTLKPDWDNIGKSLDACNKVVWHDDAQIVDGHVVKFYGEPPRLTVVVTELPGTNK